jgi:FlaA1/EpsC-like NDP-sugar epimerase
MKRKKNIVIYGAGEAGKQLFNELNKLSYNIIFFLDDDHNIKEFKGVPVYTLSEFISLKIKNIDEIYFAITAIAEKNRIDLLNKLIEHNYIVKLLPLKYNLKSDLISVADIKETSIEDIIDRMPIKVNHNSIELEVFDKVILITGAAGSIGSELLEQILLYKPKMVIALDSSELGIYNLKNRIDANNGSNKTVKYVLGSVLDNALINELFYTYRPNIVYHAAAYKHVSLVEENPFVGIQNNFLGTINVAKAAQKNNVQKFILISTDKSVRPTNVMGCSKRLAEIYIQNLACTDKFTGKYIDNRFNNTIFSMVRFGNVIGSSGSVIPLFEKQINSNRYVTVTDVNVTRFFMSIPEAVKLVLQTSSMCSGGDVFLLNMGSPVKIIDLAAKLIKLRGYDPVIIDNSSQIENIARNQIGILIIGLRTGEKLYEELLIDAESLPTENQSIFRANESFTIPSKFDGQIEKLFSIIKERSIPNLFNFLSEIEIGYSKK